MFLLIVIVCLAFIKDLYYEKMQDTSLTYITI